MHAVTDVQAFFQAALEGVRPDRLFSQALATDLWDQIQAETYERIVVVGAGKASLALTGCLEQRLHEHITAGLVVVPHGYRVTLPPRYKLPSRINFIEAGHPIPDASGVQGAVHCLDLVKSCTQNDLVIVLISGGGSALWPAFVDSISLADARQTFHLLLACGADIHELNTVRKHLSRIGGGRLATAAAPATVYAFVISDVVGDDLSVIASGPCTPDASTFEQAIDVFQKYRLWDRVPISVHSHLLQGLKQSELETPKPGDPRFLSVQTNLLGRNRDALEAALEAAQAAGYDARIVAEACTGEARTVGRALIDTTLSTQSARPMCLIWGGETTVTVQGTGKGGRNQEVALAAALALEATERDIAFLSAGTDGIDGPTDAAGAWATPQTCSLARRQGLDPEAYLADNNAYRFFERLEYPSNGGSISPLLKTGPTHTNVMDVQIAVIR